MSRIANQWKDYTCFDAGNGEKLEQWKGIVLRRPDPQAIWPANQNTKLWQDTDAIYHRSDKGGGHWYFNSYFIMVFCFTAVKIYRWKCF